MKSPEFWEKQAIDQFIKSIGAYNCKPSTGGFGSSGTPDRICCYRGHFFAVEVKRENKQPTALQWKRIGEIEDAGGKAFWGTAEKVIGEMKAWLQSNDGAL